MGAIFKKPEDLNKKSTKILSSWGEKLVALDFFNQFGDKIELKDNNHKVLLICSASGEIDNTINSLLEVF